MADYERLFLSKLAWTGRVQTAIGDGIHELHFADPELREIFAFMAEHSRTYRQAPSFLTLREKFPNHNFEICDESIDYLKEQFLSLVKWRAGVQAVRDLAKVLDSPEESRNIDELFLLKSRELANLVPSVRMSKFSDIDRRISEYEAGDPNANKTIKMGIPQFDGLTQGIQPHDYVTIAGWSGTGKSTLAQWILFNAWMQNKTPMYISLEMEANALLRKLDTMLTNFRYDSLKSRTLTEAELSLWKKKAKQVKEKDCDIHILDDVRGCTVERVHAELVRYRPDILCIDYVSLMDMGEGSAKMWEKVTRTTNGLKQVARTLKIPIIGIAQTNRESAKAGPESENIAFSVSIIQDSDLVLGLYDNEEMKANKCKQVRMLKSRDSQTCTVDLLWDMEIMKFGDFKTSHLFKNKIEEKREEE